MSCSSTAARLQGFNGPNQPSSGGSRPQQPWRRKETVLCFVPRRSLFQETVPDVSATKMALPPQQSAGGKAGLGRAYHP